MSNERVGLDVLRETMNAQTYCQDTTVRRVSSLGDSVANCFMCVGDNEHCHHAKCVEEICRMEEPIIYFVGYNWHGNAIHHRVACKIRLAVALKKEWHNLPQNIVDNLANSILKRCLFLDLTDVCFVLSPSIFCICYF